MLRKYSVIAAAIGVSLVSTGAMADHRHDKELSYVVGGALVGAAIGGLIYADRYRHYGPTVHYRYYDRGYNDYGRPYGRYARSYRARHHHHPRPRHRHRH